MPPLSIDIKGRPIAPAVMPAISVFSAMAIFLIDTFVPIGVAVAVLYAFVIFLSSSFLNQRGIIYVSIACIALTLSAFLIEHAGNYTTESAIRGTFSICVILLTTFLSISNQQANILARERQSHLLQAQVELSHVSRVTTLGELTASIAHEVNQPLAALVSNGEACLRWLRRNEPDIDAATTSVTGMISNARRASEVVARLRAMAGKSRTEQAELDLGVLADEVLLVIGRELAKHGIETVTRLDPDPHVVTGDRVQLQQVILNLVMNAMQSMTASDGVRRLTITTSKFRDGDGAWMRLDIRDTGVGLASVDAGKLFEAFYTTKRDGLGMGLSICRSIVEAHRGTIVSLPVDGEGAHFRVMLPARAPAP